MKPFGIATLQSPFVANGKVYGDGPFDWKATLRCDTCCGTGPEIGGHMSVNELWEALSRFVAEHQNCLQ